MLCTKVKLCQRGESEKVVILPVATYHQYMITELCFETEWHGPALVRRRSTQASPGSDQCD